MIFKTTLARKNVKKPSIKSAKKKAWDTFSKWVRLSNADSDGYVWCYCGKKIHWKESHASHLIPGRGNAILFDERGVYPSCMQCNIFKAGNLLEYMKFLERKLGVAEAIKLRDELLIQSKQIKKMRIADYNDITEIYKEKIKNLQGHKINRRMR